MALVVWYGIVLSSAENGEGYTNLQDIYKQKIEIIEN